VSIKVTDRVLDLIDYFIFYVQLDRNQLHHLISKFACFILYIALSRLVFTGCIQNSQPTAYNIGLPMLICIPFAIPDEFHRLFIARKIRKTKRSCVRRQWSISGHQHSVINNENEEMDERSVKKNRFKPFLLSLSE